MKTPLQIKSVYKYNHLDTSKEIPFIQAALQLINEAVMMTNAQGKILFLNSALEKLIGWSLEEARYLPISTIFSKGSGDRTCTTHSNQHGIEESPDSEHDDVNHGLLFTRDQSQISIEYSITPVHDANQQIIGNIFKFQQIHKSCKLLCEIPQRFNQDLVTGLRNRYAFEKSLEQILFNAKALDQEHIVCYLDLDRFKILNEACGHLAGDAFLKQFSAILQSRLRKTDMLARLGGDEFGLILYHCNLDQALTVLHDLREELQRNRFTWDQTAFYLTASIGVISINGQFETSSQILSAVEAACYNAKYSGRNRIRVCHHNDSDIAVQRGETLSVLKVLKALEENRFLLYEQPIQPIISASNFDHPHQNYSEILLRLRDDNGSILSPHEFLPAAERYGLMHLIDRWVIQTLFSHLHQKMKIAGSSQQADHLTCSYSINLSGASLNDDQFLEFVQEQILLYKIPPQNICFEITETIAISNLSKAAQFMSDLQTIGCCFALDDFGSGMSSFGYLQNLPINYLKIDGNFIRNITQNHITREIVEAVNRIGHAMKIRTIAEFVENETILEELKIIGVDYAQGYQISKPYRLN
jgi:diguanylate cyclase (GGDEF)-like protein/PAS domain S-box-containing protein